MARDYIAIIDNEGDGETGGREETLCAGSGREGTGEQDGQAGRLAGPYGKVHDMMKMRWFSGRKEGKIQPQIVYKILLKNFYIILIKMIDFLVLVGYIIGRCDCEKATTIDRRTHRSWIWN